MPSLCWESNQGFMYSRHTLCQLSYIPSLLVWVYKYLLCVCVVVVEGESLAKLVIFHLVNSYRTISLLQAFMGFPVFPRFQLLLIVPLCLKGLLAWSFGNSWCFFSVIARSMDCFEISDCYKNCSPSLTS